MPRIYALRFKVIFNAVLCPIVINSYQLYLREYKDPCANGRQVTFCKRDFPQRPCDNFAEMPQIELIEIVLKGRALPNSNYMWKEKGFSPIWCHYFAEMPPVELTEIALWARALAKNDLRHNASKCRCQITAFFHFRELKALFKSLLPSHLKVGISSKISWASQQRRVFQTSL